MEQVRSISLRHKRDWEFKGNNFLVTIAINKYENLPELNNAIRDAQDITETLTQLYQFDNEYTIRLFDEEATEEKIHELFMQLIEKVTEEDNLVVFFSGHGYFNEMLNSGYWIPVDGRPEKVADYISNADILNIIQNIKAHHLLLFVDSCFSGSLVSQSRSIKTNSERFPSRRVFASGRTEVVDDGIPGKNSPFAEGLLSFLRNNDEKYIDTSSMIQHVKEYVEENCQQIPIDGRVRNAGDDNGEFIFYKKISEEDLWKKAHKKNTIESYQEYLDVFPYGRHYELANSEIKKLTEIRAWNKAKGNTINDIKNYILTYPEGIFVEEAKKLLKEKEEKDTQHQEWLREQAKKKLKLENIRKEFKKFIDLGQIAITSRDYERAHQYFWQSLEYYVEGEGFIPNRGYIENKIKECNEILLFEESKRDGKRAFKNKNWELAKQYLKLAISLGNSGEIEELEKLANATDTFLNASATVNVTKGPGGKSVYRPHKKKLEVKKSNRSNVLKVTPKVRSRNQASIRVRSGGRDNSRSFERQRINSIKKRRKKKLEGLDLVVLIVVILCIVIFAILKLKQIL